MSVMTDESLRVREAAASAGVLEAAAGSLFRADGAVKIHIIRPCKGKGRGSHVYEADMLQREAGKFAGWPMFIDHETPEQIKANGGLPPSIWKLGGEVLESWWDPNVPAEGRFGQGSVDAWVKPSPWMKPVIEAHPRLVRASVNTFARAIKPRRGSNGVENVVEGFVDDGSVDWVTKDGAGGGVDASVVESVMESWLATDEANDDVAAWLREHRPAVVEALIKQPDAPEHGEEDNVKLEPKDLVEAFNALSDEQRAEVVTAVMESDAGDDAIRAIVDDRLKTVLPQAMEAAANTIEEAALAKVDERLDARTSQASLLEAARARLDGNSELTDAFREDAWARLSEHADWKPVEPDSDGNGGKTVQQVMEAAVDAEVARVKKLQEAAGVQPRQRRTAVVGNGGGEEEHERVREHEEDPDEWKHTLQEAGIDPDASFGLPSEDGKDKGKGEDA